MKYMVLIHHNRGAREQFAAMPAEVQAQGMAAYARLNEELRENGEWVAAEALADDATSVVVTTRDGAPVRTDGPFAEAKEMLAGFYLVDVESQERALEIAARIPEAQAGSGYVEVRPVLVYDLAGA
ncbi:MAG: YciI family protein [Actinobacteria bacterium]|nr:YciI family protein [Actinomycetota bacterium]